MVFTLAFLAWQLYTLTVNAEIVWADFARVTVLAGLVFVAFFEGLGILLAGFNFRALVKNISGVLVAKPLGLVVYTISNLYKYIPGGAMYVVGRNLLAVETDDLSHQDVALSTVVEGALVAIAAVVIVVVTVFDHALEHLRQAEAQFTTLFIVIVIIIVAIAGFAIIYFRQKISEGLKRMYTQIRALSPLVLLMRFGFALLLMTLWGGTFLATLIALGQEITPGMAPTIIGLFLLAWLAGFLTPGAPSGAGVREIVMHTFMGAMLGEGFLLPAMIIHRIVAAAGDVAAYGVAVGYSQVVKRRKKEPMQT